MNALRRYEAMFLFDAAAAHDWATMEQEIRRLCDRIGAQIEVCVKFDDQRKLAFEIKRRKRGTYVLAYLAAPPSKIAEMDRDATLSELILRHLVVKGDHITDARIAELKAHPVETPLSPAPDHRRTDDGGGRRYGDGDGRRREWRSGGREGRPDDRAAAIEEPAEAGETA